MSNLPVRLAVVVPSEDVNVRVEAARRVGGAQVEIITHSMQAALRADIEFEAAVVHSFGDALCAIESGKHVLVDAPVADSIEQTEKFIDAVKKAGVVQNVGRLPRHAPANQTIIDRFSSGKLGDAGLLRVHRWSSNRDQSLAEKIFGDIDQAIQLFAASPTEIYAIGQGNCSYLQIHLGFPHGGMAVLDFSDRLPAGQEYSSLSLIGSKGAAYADDHHNTHLLFGGSNPTALISESGNGYSHELHAFVNEIAGGASHSIDGDAMLTVHSVIDAVRQSIESMMVLRERGGVYEPA